MSGYLRQRAGSWELKAYVGRDLVTGRKRYRSKTVPGVSKREPVTKPGRTFGELLERWYEACAPDWSPSTAYLDMVSITRSLAVGLLTEDNLRTYSGHIWRSGKQRGRHPTAVIEKDSPKNDSSARTLSLASMSLDLVAHQRARLTERAAAAGGSYPDDGFLFPGSVDGSRPLHADTWSHRFTRLGNGIGLEAIRRQES